MLTRRANQRGFTLVELMITLAVVAILVALAAPPFQSFVENNRSVTATNEFLSALTLTRSEAVKRDRVTVLCASSDGATCTGAWNEGWIAFEDANGNGALDGGEEIFLVAEERGGGVSIVGTAGVATSYAYGPTGRAAQGIGTGHWDIDVYGRHPRVITVGRTGRAKVSEG